MGINEIIDAHFEELVKDVQGVVQMKSVLEESQMTAEHPFGSALSHALDDFLRRAASMGFKTRNIENYAGIVEMGDLGPLIGILAHLDVVPEGRADSWIYPPYEAVIEDGKIYGRGTIDDKGPAVSALYAMRALKESGEPLKARFRLILGLDEESGSRCVLRYLKTEEIPAFSFSPDAMFPVINAEKGIVRFTWKRTIHACVTPDVKKPYLAYLQGGDRFNVVPDEAVARFRNSSVEELTEIFKNTTDSFRSNGSDIDVVFKGIPAHAMEPWKGKNAVQLMIQALAQADFSPKETKDAMADLYKVLQLDMDGKSMGVLGEDAISGPLTCNVAFISFDGEELLLKFDIRYSVTMDSALLLQQLEIAAERAGSEFHLLQHKPPLYLDSESTVIQKLLTAYKAVTGEEGHAFGIGGGTYCRFFPNAVSYGPLFPGEEETAHQPNEFIAIESLKRMTHIYAEALRQFNIQE